MKTTLVSVLTVILLGFASRASGRPLDAADLTATLFVIGLIAWFIQQYSRPSRCLLAEPPVHLPIRSAAVRQHPTVHHRAA